MLTYSAHKADCVFTYPGMMTPAVGLFGSMLPGSGGGGNSVFSAVSSDPRPSQQPPLALPVAMATELNTHLHMGISLAVKQLGGYEILIYLVGRVVELEAPSQVQAKCLDILLHWLRCHVQQMRSFLDNDGQVMLRHLFSSERCHAGKDVASVLLNACCSGAVVAAQNDQSEQHRWSDAVVVDSELLRFVVECWRHWCRSDTFQLVLRALQNLLRDNHPQRQFNVRQMERAGVLQVLLQVAKV